MNSRSLSSTAVRSFEETELNRVFNSSFDDKTATADCWFDRPMHRLAEGVVSRGFETFGCSLGPHVSRALAQEESRNHELSEAANEA